MAAPQIYRSTDGSAPVLPGTAGALVTVLDAVLVNGYGSKTAAGWTKPYTATNAAVFRMGGGNQFYLDINDNGASSGLTGASGKEAAVRGYEAMTAASTGTGPFPTTVQVAATDANWRKSATADATARAWFIAADDRSFVLGILDGDVASRYKLYVFGDIYSLKSGDAYRVGITVRTAVNSTSAAGAFGNVLTTTPGSQTAGAYLARGSASTGGSIPCGLSGVGSSWETALSFTSALDGNIQCSDILVADVATPPVLRGRLRGLYEILTPVGLADADTFTGTGALTGRAFVVARNFVAGTNACLAIQTAPDWDTSS